MKFLVVQVNEVGDTVVINPQHVVVARRMTPPVTELVLTNGTTLRIQMSLDELLAEVASA